MLFFLTVRLLNNLSNFEGFDSRLLSCVRIHLAQVVQKLDSAIHRINLYPLDNAIGFPNAYPLDSDLSGG